MKNRILWLIALLLLAAPRAWAADGDPCSGGYVAAPSSTCLMVCDGKSGDGACSPRTRLLQAHERVWIEVADETGCAGYSILVTTVSKLTGGVEHTLGTLTYGGDTMLLLDGFGHHPLSYVEATISGHAGCSNLDVLMHMR